MLTDLTSLKTLLGVTGSAGDPLLSLVLVAADSVCKKWTKRDLEQAAYTEFYSGTGTRDLILRQYPVALSPPPRVFHDPDGYGGQAPAAFPADSELTLGVQFVLVTAGAQENRGVLRRIGGTSGPGIWTGSYAETWVGGSLAARRLPLWHWGDSNLKVIYTAGYSPVPADLSMACLELAAWLRRNAPLGALLASESLGDYAYSLLQMPPLPEIGSIRGILSTYRDLAVGRW